LRFDVALILIVMGRLRLTRGEHLGRGWGKKRGGTSTGDFENFAKKKTANNDTEKISKR
jgi:hypothetical protein